jgi:hypothetical protein
MTPAPERNWATVDFYIAAVAERIEEARRTGDVQLGLEAADEMRLIQIDLREMAARGIVRPAVP